MDELQRSILARLLDAGDYGIDLERFQTPEKAAIKALESKGAVIIQSDIFDNVVITEYGQSLTT